MKDPKWWEFWKSNPEPYTAYDQIREEDDKELIISEPVRSIVKAMVDDRKRFIVQVDYALYSFDTEYFKVLDIDTEEEFLVAKTFLIGFHTNEHRYFGPSWASEHEIKWAVETLHAHYYNLRDRARRIKTARERNRLIEIYA